MLTIESVKPYCLLYLMLVRSRLLPLMALLLAALPACQKDSASPAPPKVPSYMVSTLAGAGFGAADGEGAAAQFSRPVAVAIGPQGTLYVVDEYTHRIRTVSPTGVVQTLAGGGNNWGRNGGEFADGQGSEARFRYPQGIAVDAQGNVYVGDTFNHRIRKISPAGLVSTLAGSGPSGYVGYDAGGYVDGPGSTARFLGPSGVAVDAQGTVYVADYGNNRIRKISPAGVVSTLAGSGERGGADGTGNIAQFDSPQGITVDVQGTVYVTEIFGNRVRKITPAGVVSTLTGTGEEGYVDGPGSMTKFYHPNGIAVDARGWVFVADAGNNTIRRITPAGVVTTLAGTAMYGRKDGHDYEAQFDKPSGLAMNAQGVIYVTDYNSNRIRVLTPRPQ